MADEKKPSAASAQVGKPRKPQLNLKNEPAGLAAQDNEHEQQIGGRVYEVLLDSVGYGPDLLEKGDLIRPQDAPKLEIEWAEQNGVIRHAPEHARRFADYLAMQRGQQSAAPRPQAPAAVSEGPTAVLTQAQPDEGQEPPRSVLPSQEPPPGPTPFPDYLTPQQIEALRAEGYEGLEDLREATDEELLKIPGVGDGTVRRIRG